MQAAIVPLAETQVIPSAPPRKFFPPLRSVTRTHVTTEEAAHHLNRKPQTLRMWACYENGPLHPIRLNGRLGWRVSDIKTLLSGSL